MVSVHLVEFDGRPGQTGRMSKGRSSTGGLSTDRVDARLIGQFVVGFGEQDASLL